MKRILTILFVFLSVASFGQVYQAMPQAGYGPVKRMRVDSVLSIPIGIPALRNITGGKDTGQIRYVTSDSSIYVFTGSTWVKAGGSGGGGPFTPDTIVAKYPIRIDTTGVRDTIFLAQAFLDSVYNGTTGFGTGLITAGVIQTDTVINITPPIVWKRNGTVLTQNTGQGFPITRASPNNYRTDLIYITGADTLGYIQGVENLLNPAAPIVPVDGIVVTYVNVFDSTTVTTSGPPSTYQRTAVVYVDANTGQLATDSAYLSWNQNNKSLLTDSLSSRRDILVTTLRIGRGNNTVAGNISIGQNSLSAITTGGNNTSIGDLNLSSNTTGTGNVAIGFNTLVANVTGLNNTAVGPSALTVNTGSFNAAFGNGALFRNTTGTRNMAVGYWTMLNNTTGSENTAVGVTALRANKTGNNNTAIGRETLWADSFANNNTALGYRAGYANNKSNSVFLGYEAGRNNTEDDRLYISNSSTSTPLIYGEFDTSRVKIHGALELRDYIGGIGNRSLRFRTNNVQRAIIDSLGNTGINEPNPLYKLHITGTAGAITQYMIGNLFITNGGLGTNTINAQTNILSAVETRLDIGHLTRGATWTQGDIIDLSGNAPINDIQPWCPITLQTGTVTRASGTATNGMISFRPTYNFTGTYSGETVGIEYRPTLTSLNNTTHIALRATSGQVVIGAVTPAASAAVDITSTDKGFLPPRMDSSQMVGITAPATGLQVYNTTDSNNYVYDGLSWKSNWLTRGNSRVNASQFIGSNNNAAVRFRANNTESFYIDSSNAGVIFPPISTGNNIASRTLNFQGRSSNGVIQRGYLSYEGQGADASGGIFNIGNAHGEVRIFPSNGQIYVDNSNSRLYSQTNGFLFYNNSTTDGWSIANNANQTSGNLFQVRAFNGNASQRNPFTIFANGNVKIGNLIGTTALIDSGYTADITGNAVRIANTPGTSTPNSSVLLELRSTDRGFLPPKMTGAQVEAITGPAEGLMVYATSAGTGAITSKGWWGYDGTTWVKLN